MIDPLICHWGRFLRQISRGQKYEVYKALCITDYLYWYAHTDAYKIISISAHDSDSLHKLWTFHVTSTDCSHFLEGSRWLEEGLWPTFTVRPRLGAFLLLWDSGIFTPGMWFKHVQTLVMKVYWQDRPPTTTNKGFFVIYSNLCLGIESTWAPLGVWCFCWMLSAGRLVVGNCCKAVLDLKIWVDGFKS